MLEKERRHIRGTANMITEHAFEILADTVLNRLGLVAREFKRIV